MAEDESNLPALRTGRVKSEGLDLKEVIAGRQARREVGVMPAASSVHTVDTPCAAGETILADLEPVEARRARRGGVVNLSEANGSMSAC
jgi:hypothetical protein